MLTTNSGDILIETHESLNKTTEGKATSFAVLVFFEESIAKRVSGAFKHAAELCRGKEPF
jgi:hypothetical protein